MPATSAATKRCSVAVPYCDAGDDPLPSLEPLDSRDSVDVIEFDDGSAQLPAIEVMRNRNAGVSACLIESNQRIAAALNTGLEAAEVSYDYVARLDCGDLCVNERIGRDCLWSKRSEPVDGGRERRRSPGSPRSGKPTSPRSTTVSWPTPTRCTAGSRDPPQGPPRAGQGVPTAPRSWSRSPTGSASPASRGQLRAKPSMRRNRPRQPPGRRAGSSTAAPPLGRLSESRRRQSPASALVAQYAPS